MLHATRPVRLQQLEGLLSSIPDWLSISRLSPHETMQTAIRDVVHASEQE